MSHSYPRRQRLKPSGCQEAKPTKEAEAEISHSNSAFSALGFSVASGL